MAIPVIQTSFAAGELSPSLYARVDLAKYKVGAALLRNFFVDYRGGATNRAGTMAVGRVKDSTKKNRLISFTFSTIQTYALVFGNLTMRVVKNGGFVLEAAKNIVGVTQANPGVFNIVAHGWSAGDQVFIAGALGMTGINSTTGYQYLVNTVPDADHVTFTDLDGNVIDTSAMPAYTGGGTAARVYTLATPYVDTDLALLKITQSADTMTITHPGYQPRQLTRTGHAAWTLTVVTFQPAITPPAGLPVITPSAAGATTYSYVVTAVAASGAESVASSIGATAVSAIMSQVAGARQGVSWAAVAGAIYYNVYRAAEVAGGATPVGVLYGFVGSATGIAFSDQNITPDFSRTPPIGNNPFSSSSNYPSCTSYWQGRQQYAATANSPLELWMSKSGDYLNLDYSIPTRANDEIDITIASQQVNAIKHLVPMQSLICMTASGAWRVDSGASGTPVTPASIVAVPQAYIGSSDVPPIVIGYDIIYVQAKGSIVRSLAYNVYSTSFTEAKDMTVLANHLFYGHTISEWAYAEEPFKIIWAVRDDGPLLAFTFLKEQDVYAWTHHDTIGQFKSVCAITEGSEDAVYLIVQRLIGGKYLQIVERMASRSIAGDVTKAWFVDCGLQYPLTYPAATITPTVDTGETADQPVNGVPSITSAVVINGGAGYVAPAVAVTDPTGTGANLTATVVLGVITAINVVSGGTGYTRPVISITDAGGGAGGAAQAVVQSNVVFTASAATFTAGDIGKALRVNGGYAIVTGYTDTTHITANIINALSNAWPSISGAWSLTQPVTTVSGLEHLNGQTVAILADGNVEPRQVVANGTVTLSHSASAIFVGLPYQAQLQTLYIDTNELPTSQGRRMTVPAVTVRVQDTRGLKLGPDFASVKAIKERSSQLPGQPIQLFTGDERVLIPSVYKTPGQIVAQQDDPLPATILGLIPEITVGDK